MCECCYGFSAVAVVVVGATIGFSVFSLSLPFVLSPPSSHSSPHHSLCVCAATPLGFPCATGEGTKEIYRTRDNAGTECERMMMVACFVVLELFIGRLLVGLG